MAKQQVNPAAQESLQALKQRIDARMEQMDALCVLIIQQLQNQRRIEPMQALQQQEHVEPAHKPSTVIEIAESIASKKKFIVMEEMDNSSIKPQLVLRTKPPEEGGNDVIIEPRSLVLRSKLLQEGENDVDIKRVSYEFTSTLRNSFIPNQLLSQSLEVSFHLIKHGVLKSRSIQERIGKVQDQAENVLKGPKNILEEIWNQSHDSKIYGKPKIHIRQRNGNRRHWDFFHFREIIKWKLFNFLHKGIGNKSSSNKKGSRSVVDEFRHQDGNYMIFNKKDTLIDQENGNIQIWRFMSLHGFDPPQISRVIFKYNHKV